MKKGISLILILMLLLSFAPVGAETGGLTAEAGTYDVSYTVGDVNDNGAVDLEDVMILRRYLAGSWEGDIIEPALDVTGDGTIDEDDLTELRRYVVGGYGVDLSEGVLFTVTFDVNDGETFEVEEQLVAEGAYASEPITPEREGYTFVGWTLSMNGDDFFDFNTEIVEDVYLYGKWEAINQMTVSLSISNEELFTGEGEEEVCFYATLENPREDILEVVLLNDHSQLIGLMEDNGQYSSNGDEFSGDNIYSTRAFIDVSQVDKLMFRVEAVCESGYSCVDTTWVTVYPSMSDEEIEEMETVDNTIAENVFDAEGFEEKTEEEKAEMVQAELCSLGDQGLVMNDTICVNEDNTIVSFNYNSGAVGNILLRDWSDEQNSPASEREAAQRDAVPASVAAPAMFSAGDSAALLSEDSYTTGDMNAMILWSFNQPKDNPALRKGFYEDLQEEWTLAGVNTTVNFDATVEDYKHLNGYEILVFSGHGMFGYCGTNEDGSLYAPALVLHEIATPEKDILYSADLKRLRIGKLIVKPTFGEPYTVYTILPDFWEAYYRDGGLDGTFVFSENCDFYGNSGTIRHSMANALLDCSAEAVVGFHNAVMAGYSRNILSEYIGSLIGGYTAEESLEKATEKYGEDDDFIGRELFYGDVAYPILKGKEDARLQKTELENNSFDDATTFAGWKKQGDVRIISKLGELTPRDGSKMAVLTTGIGSGETGYLEATEGSVLYQSFQVPADATTLYFGYNVVSEEPEEWIGSEYDDKFVAELIIRDSGKKITFAKEAVNEAVWQPVYGVNFDGGDDSAYKTGWRQASLNVTDYRNQMVTLRFCVYDVGDSAYDTAALVDEVYFSNAAPVTDKFTYTQKSVVVDEVYDDDAYAYFYDFAEKGATVPGLKGGVVPQGVAYRKDTKQYYISGYIPEEADNSVIMVVDALTHQYVGEYYLNNQDGSDHTGHAGGIAITKKNLYVTAGKSLARIPLSQIDALNGYGHLYFTETIDLAFGAASLSFCNYDPVEGMLWVGNFWESTKYNDKAHADHKALAMAYQIDDSTDDFLPYMRVADGDIDYLPSFVVKIPEKIQGITVMNETLFLSRSYGRKATNKSAIYVGNIPYRWGEVIDEIEVEGTMLPVFCFEADDEIIAPPMMEGIAYDGKSIAVLFESGAKKYREDGGEHVIDRLWHFTY